MTTVLGREVNGEIVRLNERKAEQWSDDQFLPLLDALLACDKVHSVRWRQYTPYFNDGEPCIFHVDDPYVRLIDGDEEDGDYADGYVSIWEMRDDAEFESVLPTLKKFQDALPHFEDFLEVSFGDHATVTATKAGFNVEFYEHD